MNGTIAIPNDPSNEGRALLLVEKAGLIRLKNGDSLYSTPADITYNSRNIKFVELEAAQLARSLQDVDAAVINTNYAIPAGLSPIKDAIYREDADSPYANLIVIRKAEMDDPRISDLVHSIQSQEVLEAASKIFNDQAISAW
jgi:D-methionine transport system substrate-binding protein